MKIKANKATIIKKGVSFTLINPEIHIPIEDLCEYFGENTVIVNELSTGLLEFEGKYDLDYLFNSLEEISALSWEEIEIHIKP